MTILERIQREPAALLAFATAVLTVLTATEVLTLNGAAIALGVLTAALGLLRYVVTPAAEVALQVKPDGAVQVGSEFQGAVTSEDGVLSAGIERREGEHRAEPDVTK